MRRLSLVCLLAVAAQAQPILSIEPATPGVTFSRPVGVEAAPGGGERLYVLEQGSSRAPSRILTLVPGDAEATVFLDLSGRAQVAGEGGLLGLAFHPDYATNGRLFVSYTAPPGETGVLTSRVSEFSRSETDPLVADPASERVVLAVAQPANNHNGGTVDFGPDGYLYVGLGDGGGGGDPYANGQDPSTLLGAILRLDVDVTDLPYGIPAGNPFAATDGPERPEIWAYGFRNPFKFDVSEAGLWVGDVGQGTWEEIDAVEPGRNYGWNQVEGPACYQSGCDLDAFAPPVVAYRHDESGGVSVTGGYVYRGLHSELDGSYLYGDFGSGRLWRIRSLPEDPGEPEVLLESVPGPNGEPRTINISSIDPSPDGRDVLVTDYGGTVYRLVPRATAAEDVPTPAALALALAGPNPFRDATAVRVEAPGFVRVSVLDVRGREVAVLWEGRAPRGPLAVPGDLAPGVYVVRADSGHQSETLRLVRVR